MTDFVSLWGSDFVKNKKPPVESAISKELRNRIVGTGSVKPDTLLAYPKNWRSHSADQESALEGLLKEVGWVSNVNANRKTGHLLEGNLRVELAKKRGEKAVPVAYVGLSEKEEELVFATLEPLGYLAGIDAKRLESLLASLDPDSIALQKLVGDLEEELGIGKEKEVVATLLNQTVQPEPGKEFVVMCDDEEESANLKLALGLLSVRRGGCKAGSAFDAVSTERVLKARRFELLD